MDDHTADSVFQQFVDKVGEDFISREMNHVQTAIQGVFKPNCQHGDCGCYSGALGVVVGMYLASRHHYVQVQEELKLLRNQ
jgi:hypothetical protein